MSTDVTNNSATKPVPNKTVTKKTATTARRSTTTPRRATAASRSTTATASRAAKKGPARKTVPAAQHTAVATAVHRAVAPDERRGMIATMAYYRSEQRGFEPGWELDDWLESERIVDTMLTEAPAR